MTTRIAASSFYARTLLATYKEKKETAHSPTVSELKCLGKSKISSFVGLGRLSTRIGSLLLHKSQDEGKGIANKTASLS